MHYHQCYPTDGNILFISNAFSQEAWAKNAVFPVIPIGGKEAKKIIKIPTNNCYCFNK